MEDKKYIQSVERALKILTFIADNREARLNDISAYAGLKTSTAFGLLQTLEHAGYIARTNKGLDYCLGLNSLKLGLCYSRESGLSEKIHQLLCGLVDAVDETAYFEIGIGKRYYYYDVVLSTRPLKVVPDNDLFINLPEQSAVTKVFSRFAEGIRYATDIEEVEKGLNCFAVPFRSGDTLIGCVALSGPSNRFTREKMETAYQAYLDIMKKLDLWDNV